MDFEIPKNMDRYLAELSKLYAQNGRRQLQEIVVNSHIRIDENCAYDNWNGGTHGHSLYLTIPEQLYLKAIENKDDFQNEIRECINKICNVRNEFIHEVFLEMDFSGDQNWRKESGLLIEGQRFVSSEAEKRIWSGDGFRIFLSHKAEVKGKVAELKESLKLFGISSFVAHEDILPTKEWQDEIENALFSMDAFVALMTENFHGSLWTDQEVGVAFGRGVPIISIKLGCNPYGFIGKFQALSCSWESAPKEIVLLWINRERMLNSYIDAVHRCQGYFSANTLSEILPFIKKLSATQANRLVSAFNENSQVRDSFGFNGKNSRFYGTGLIPHLERLTDQRYGLSHGKITPITPIP